MRMKLISGCLCWTLLASAAVGLAQEAVKNPKLPVQANVWINSSPLTNEMLAGKAAVLFFFDAQDRGVIDGWPKLLQSGSKFDGSPVLFIGVNSGTPRPRLEAYLKQNKIPWPVICDSDRSFENQFGFRVSPMEARNLRLLMPDGGVKSGEVGNVEGAAVDALRDAKWKVDPQGLPPALQSAWQAIEFGKSPDAAQTLKKSLNGKGDIKEAATKLNQVVRDDLSRQLEDAKKSLDDGKKWDAFKRYSVIPPKFKGYTVPAEVASNIKDLAGDDAIKEEQAAMKQLDLAIQAAQRSPSARKGALKQLQKLIDDHPSTEAAAEAQKLIDQAGT